MYASGHPPRHLYAPASQQNLGQSASAYNPGSPPSLSYRNERGNAQPSAFPPQVAPAPAAPHTASTSMAFRYYQPPKHAQPESDSDDNSSEEEHTRRASRGKSTSSSLQSRRGACSHCKGLKVKCFFTQGQASCSRCSQNNLQCIVSGRKKRRAVATHEELIVKSHKQDIEIRNLLQKLDELGTEHRVQSWIAKSKHLGQPNSPRSDPTMPSSQSSSDFSRDGTTRWTSSSSFDYFAGSSTSHMLDGSFKFEPGLGPPSPGAKTVSVSYLMNFFRCDLNSPRVNAPDIVTRGLIQPEDVENLFRTYFELINPYFSILDPALHTPDRLIWESHFLFTVICTLAAKYVQKYSGIATTLREFVRDAAGRALVQGKKTVDECQAFLLIAVYQAPQKKWEEQRGWLHMGIAFSLAHELKLNEPISLEDFLRATPERNAEVAERLWLNQTRTWLNCYCVDASHATQFGKPAMIATDDYVARHCTEWYHVSRYSQAYDVHLVSYVEILRRMRRFRTDTDRLETQEREIPKKPKKLKEMMEIAMSCHRDLIELDAFWRQRFAGDPRRHQDHMCGYREETNRMNNAFNRLVVLFRGLQKAVSIPSKDGGGLSRGDELVRLCIDTAIEVITQMTEKLSATQMLKYSMEAHFLFVTFAAAHLLSLMSPNMSVLLQTGDVERIDHYIRELVGVLRMVTSDRQANPYLYARYLMKQLKKFSPVTPSNVAEASPVYHYGRGNRPEGGTLRLDVDVSGAGPRAWARHDGAATAAAAPYSGMPSAGGSLSSPDSFQEIAGGPAVVVDTGAGEGAAVDYLSGFNLDFSLTNFIQNLNHPTFAKATPPPDEVPAGGEWWQAMYPVSASGPPQATEWPLAMGGHAHGHGHTHAGTAAAVDIQRVHYHMDVVR